MNHLRELELRVLDGEQQGAHCSVPRSAPTLIGGDLSSDIVLSGGDAAGRLLSLTPRGRGLRLAVLRGDARLGERLLSEGEAAGLPLYTPLRLGDTVIALGDADEPEWTLLPTPEDGADSDEDETSTQTARTGRARSPAHAQRWSRRLITGGGAVAAVSVAMLAFAYTATPLEKRPSLQQQARQVESALHAAGFAQLTAQAQAGGDIAVTGTLDSSEQRNRVEQLLATQALPTRLSVQVNEQIASAVVDVYRVNGVAAQAKVTGQGDVLVSTQESDMTRLKRTESVARRDVPGLSRIEARNAPPPPAPEPTPVIRDPGKRIASIVPGDPGYVVTSDGSRYFEGALLPTGHRIAGIADHEVLLEKGGMTTPLKF